MGVEALAQVGFYSSALLDDYSGIQLFLLTGLEECYVICAHLKNM